MGQRVRPTAGCIPTSMAGLMDTRMSGRSIRMRLEATADAPFSVGRTRIDLAPGGEALMAAHSAIPQRRSSPRSAATSTSGWRRSLHAINRKADANARRCFRTSD